MTNETQNNVREERRYGLGEGLKIGLRRLLHPNRTYHLVRSIRADEQTEKEMTEFYNKMKEAEKSSTFKVPLYDPSVGFNLSRTLSWRNELRRSTAERAKEREYFGFRPTAIREPQHPLIDAADNGELSMDSPVSFYYDSSGAKRNWAFLDPIEFKSKVNYEPLSSGGL